ncbi:ABC transporter ATP-binding protein, partial [Kitasatospora sp. NPDC093558]|uniref:ABC transporter ATP-binding protein n=1 Tax=Kitasatospora sp. NPDC093558 TaxID=3155201 RepID=UPI00341321ED
MAELVLDGLTKHYPDGAVAVRDVDLTVADGEFVILVGPSGCGKSTTLNMIAGLEDITAGTLRIGGRVVNDLAPKDRDIAMVFQSYALYPHMTVRQNMGFALRLAGTVGAPQELYDRPVNLFVAGFIGSPAMNVLDATLEEGALRTALVVFPL